MADLEDQVPESEIAQAIRDALTTQLTGMSVADALLEVSKSLDRIAAALEARGQPDRTRYRSP